ncbi:MAG TPA: DASS family sodium-coupled anion symporter [Methanocorpusculum sp.]|nr:DASS family sodium-coupled anion symporter [Methanocorpusculum sp.]
MNSKKWIGFVVGIFAFLIILLLPLESVISHEAKLVAAVTVLMIIFWVTQPIPIEATSLIPLVAFPLLGILNMSDTATPYADPVIFLFLGGFMIAMAMQRWNLHRRIAMKLISFTGTSPSQLILGFMIGTAFISMWMSNAATAMMMIPIAIAIVATVIPKSSVKDMNASEKAFAGCLVLGIAYAATVGGMATLIGCAPNAVFASMLIKFFPTAPPVDFFSWILFGLPFVIILLFIVWLWLTKITYRKMPKTLDHAKEALQKEIEEMEPMSRGEKNTLFVLILAALLWIFKDPKDLGGVITIPGLNSLHHAGLIPFPIADSTIAIFCAFLLFIIPVSIKNHELTLNWKWAVKIPWGVLLLFGGGLSLSAAFKASGLSEAIGKIFYGISIPPILIVLFMAFVVMILTAFTSNTAIANIMMPAAVSVAVGLQMNPFILMMTVAIASSLSFMLPVSTPPNAIAYGTQYVEMKDMVTSGGTLNLIAILLFTILLFTIGFTIFGMDASLPEWTTTMNLPLS